VTPKAFNLGGTVQDVLTRFQNRLLGEVESVGLTTGYPAIDEFTNGLKPGELFVISSRPGMGSTTLMLNITEHICVDQKTPSLVVSCDLDAPEIIHRLIFSRARVDDRRFDSKHMPTDLELTRVKSAADELSVAPLTVKDPTCISIEALCATARRLHGEDKVGFIAIDHLQRLETDSFASAGTRRKMVKIVADLEGLARELQVPIVLISGMTRGPEHRKGKDAGIPRLSDLYHPMTIWRHAAWIGLLYREAFYRDEPDESAKGDPAHLILRNVQQCDVVDVPLSFHAERRHFEAIKVTN